jgi:Flp pilus assembly protein TadG
MMGTHTRHSHERGQVVVMFALLLPVFLALGGFVIGIGNWYTHAKHLQTKADSGAFAGGNAWAFPCGSQIDARIIQAAQAYAGPNNPQIGGVPNASIHTVLNASAWYDDDSNPAPTQYDSPPSNPTTTPGALCTASTLDVKVTEDNSFPLASLIPLFPDIKRKARIEIQEAAGITGLLPVAIRAPEPVSAAAIFSDHSDGTIRAVKYLVRKPTGIFNLPAGLQGWSTENSEDLTNTWAQFTPPAGTDVTIAVSFRGACYDSSIPGYPNSPPTQTKIALALTGPCFQDQGFTSVNGPTGLCNQGGSTQIVNCYYATGTYPNESVQSGLTFIRGYADVNPALSDPPAIESAYLTSINCSVSGMSSPAYFNAHPNSTCQAQLSLTVDVGGLIGEYGAPGAAGNEPLHDEDIQVRYRLVRGDGTSSCNYGANCSLNGGNGQGPALTYTTTGGGSEPHLPLTAQSGQNAVAIEIQIRNTTNHPNAFCRNGGFSNSCRWYYTGSGMFAPSVAPTDAQILADPIQRAFRGNSVVSSSVQWLRLTADQQCDNFPDQVDVAANSQRSNSCKGFIVELGLKGGLAQTANEQPILFNDGIGSSQMGGLDCDPTIPQGQEMIEGIKNGCNYWYDKHPFDWNPLCPAANNVFTTPNPGAPWNDGRWPPLRCVKTRPTGSSNQMERGFKGRFFGNENANSCPGGANGGPGYIKGRNYWDKDTNNGYVPAPGAEPLGYKDGAHDTLFQPGDPRIVTIFITTTEAFTGSGQNTYPITGFVEIYVTGFGRIQGNGSLNIDDPCPGSAPPTDLDLSGGSNGGYAMWGHMIKYSLTTANGQPSGIRCNPTGSLTPCVPVLVE